MSFLSNIKDSFGLGLGSSIADRLTDTIFGPRTINVQQIAPINTDIEQKNKDLFGDKYNNIMQLLQQNVSPTSGGTRKFNLKQLLKSTNQKNKTHRNISFKSKQHKGGKSIFARRTKKNI